MKFFVRCWIIAVFLSGPAIAHATGCRAVAVRRNVVVVQKKAVAIVAAAVVTPVVAQYVNYPLYSAVYSDGNNEVLKQLIAQNQTLIQQYTQLVERVRTDGGNGGGSPLSPVPMTKAEENGKKEINPEQEVLQMFSSAGCVACHDSSKSATLGKGFTLTEGNGKALNAKLGPEEFGKVISKVADGSMPKGRTLTAEQRLQFISTLVKQ